ncbi:hypothetical protein HERIO_2577 [Hepatospora eriocheir]|uniref:Uncharacterized protein n=1 Tax=Hepatospora eriocheir TaxID=1081669 RepID=A0A1X0Q6E2_9MICR|nr:hypothetical protein HERIO_2577 [Hepatospora eriocheir]
MLHLVLFNIGKESILKKSKHHNCINIHNFSKLDDEIITVKHEMILKESEMRFEVEKVSLTNNFNFNYNNIIKRNIKEQNHQLIFKFIDNFVK